jgi:hypothetical protein
LNIFAYRFIQRLFVSIQVIDGPGAVGDLYHYHSCEQDDDERMVSMSLVWLLTRQGWHILFIFLFLFVFITDMIIGYHFDRLKNE